MIGFILIILLIFSVFFLIDNIIIEKYQKKINKKLNSLIKRMKMYEYNQKCIFDEIINSKGVYYHKKGKNCK